jgi:predicted transcriptional regulator of viral defense system
VPEIRDLYKRLHALRVFTTSDAAKLTGTPVGAVAKQLSYLHARSEVEKIRRGLWAVIPIGEETAQANPYLVGARLAGDQPYALSYHTALELHGVAHSPSDQIYVGVTGRPFTPMDHNGVRYRSRSMAPWEADWTTAIQVEGQEVHITDREATLVLCAQSPQWSGGVEEVMRSVGVWPSIDAERVLEFTRRLGKKTAYHRVGYILETNRERWGIGPRILEAFQKEVKDRSPDYWGTGPRHDNTYNKDYRIIVPAAVEGLRGA